MTYARSGSKGYRGWVKDACFPRCCSRLSSLRYSSSHYIERFSDNADKLVNLVHLEKQASKVGPETALE